MRRQSVSGLSLVVRADREEAALWRRCKADGDADAREALFARYAGLARSIAHRQFQARPRQGVDFGDVLQYAHEGLLQAIDRFDPWRAHRFAAYARARIAGQISNGLAAMTEANAQYDARRRAEQDRLRSLANRGEGTPESPLAALSEIAVGLALGLMLERGGDAGITAIADETPSAYDSLAWRQLIVKLDDAVDRLPPREAMIVRQHYANAVSFTALATLLGCSKGRVSQLHRQALERLRQDLKSYR